MAETVTLITPATFQNDTSAVAATATNNAAITTAFLDVLSLSGSSPNQMKSNLDMNSNQIINLPAPATINSPARLQDVVSNPTISVPPTGTSGATVPFLNGNNTWSGTNAFDSTSTFVGAVTLPSATVTNANLASGIAITNAQLNTMASDTVKGNVTGGSAVPTDLTQTQLTTLINPVTSSLSGAAPASGGGTTNFLRADSTWASPATSGNYVLLATYTAANSATLGANNIFTNAYSSYEIVFNNLIPSNNETILGLQVYTSGAYQTSGYVANGYTVVEAAVTAPTTYIPLTYSTTTAQTFFIGNAYSGASGKIRVFNPSASQVTQFLCESTYMTTVPANLAGFYSGCYNTVGATPGFQIMMLATSSTSASYGTIVTGTVKVYGIT